MLYIFFTLALAIGGMLALAFDRADVLIAALLIPPAIWMAIKRPIFMFGGVIVLGGWTKPLGGGSMQLTPYKLGLITLVGLGVFSFARGERLAWPSRWLIASILGLLILIAISEIASGVAVTQTMVTMLGIALTVFMARQFVTSSDGLRLLAVVLFAGQLWMAASIWQELGWARMMIGTQVRAHGLADQPNRSSAMAVGWLFPALPLLFDRAAHRRYRVLAAVGVIAFVYTIFGTASRSATVAAVAGTVVFFVARLGSLRQLMPTMALIGIVGFGAYTFAPESYVLRMTSTVEVGDETGGSVEIRDSQRRELAISSLQYIAESPLLGRGRVGAELSRLRRTGVGKATHSTYLRMADSYGLPALAILLFVLAQAFRSAIRMRNRDDEGLRLYSAGMLAGLAAFLMYDLTNSDIVNKSVWFIVAIVAAVDGHHRQRDLSAGAAYATARDRESRESREADEGRPEAHQGRLTGVHPESS